MNDYSESVRETYMRLKRMVERATVEAVHAVQAPKAAPAKTAGAPEPAKDASPEGEQQRTSGQSARRSRPRP
jgi:hypothetical protein